MDAVSACQNTVQIEVIYRDNQHLERTGFLAHLLRPQLRSSFFTFEGKLHLSPKRNYSSFIVQLYIKFLNFGYP